jgi:hypothetical protein
MKLALSLTTVEVQTEEDVETDAAEGVINKANQAILIDLYTFSFSFFKKPGQC